MLKRLVWDAVLTHPPITGTTQHPSLKVQPIAYVAGCYAPRRFDTTNVIPAQIANVAAA